MIPVPGKLYRFEDPYTDLVFCPYVNGKVRNHCRPSEQVRVNSITVLMFVESLGFTMNTSEIRIGDSIGEAVIKISGDPGVSLEIIKNFNQEGGAPGGVYLCSDKQIWISDAVKHYRRLTEILPAS